MPYREIEAINRLHVRYVTAQDPLLDWEVLLEAPHFE